METLLDTVNSMTEVPATATGHTKPFTEDTLLVHLVVNLMFQLDCVTGCSYI